MIASLRRIAAVCVVTGMSIAGLARADEPPAVQRGTGRIVALMPTHVTIQLKGDGGERMLELVLNDRTRVVTSSDDVVRVVTGRGDVQELRKAIDAKVGDLKVNHWVNVFYRDGVAVQVFSSMIGREIGEGGERPREVARDGDRPSEPGRRDGTAPGAEDAADRPRDVAREGDQPREGAREPARDVEGRMSATAASLIVGDIAGVDGNKLTVNLTRRNQRTGATSVMTFDGATDVRIEGNAGKPADLRPGMPVSVTVEKGVAVRIEVPIDLSKPRQ